MSRRLVNYTTRKLGFPERVFSNRLLDFSLGFFGLLLAAMSGYFPYYVYTNEDNFHPPKMTFSGQANVENSVVEISQRPRFDNQKVSRLTTGSIVRSEIKSQSIIAQRTIQKSDRDITLIARDASFPFQLIFASRGRAIIRFGNDVVAVAAGSRLPDGTHVKSVSFQDKKWRLVTTSNKVLLLQ